MASKLTKRSEDYSKWYNDLVAQADLAEASGVRGCMIIKPYGFAIWEKMQRELDRMFKETGHQNVYFPIFIPKSYFAKEANHVKGFAKECAVVTHYRLKSSENGKGLEIDPDAKLEEELIVRPTSETIIWDTYRRWIQSYRDLPLLLNQWANVVRWEMRTRPFLRTSEFLWQEGHTAHATKKEAMAEAQQMINLYTQFVETFISLPVIKGKKTDSERFAGADITYCIEALMQDGKALQAGTSHFLGQNFPKAFDVKFANKEGKKDYVWATSWGVSTRLIGALIMAHSDDRGLVLPPKLAPIQVVVVPIYKGSDGLTRISEKIMPIIDALKARGISIKYDDSDTQTPGWKFSQYELKGVPVRIAVGSRDIKNSTIEVVRRDTLTKEMVPMESVVDHIVNLMTIIQENIYKRALDYRNQHITEVNSMAEFSEVLETKGGFLSAHWDGTSVTENRIKEMTKATIRCIPMEQQQEIGKCILTGSPSKGRVLFARAY